MTDTLLDKDQERALASNVQLIEAGPGAGKTRTIVERMRRQSKASPRGVALVSFTNTATDEARLRCGPDLAYSPNYVGTLDSFLHRFLVTPTHVRQKRKVPNYLSSWNALPVFMSIVRIDGVSGTGVPLSAFQVGIDGSVRVPASASNSFRGYIQEVERLGKTADLEQVARSRIKSHLRSGLFDSDTARLKALHVLQDEESEVRRLLAYRFSEVIIDEFQDCSDIEVSIVNELKRLGIHVTVVADPDQAIYEFRNAPPDSYDSYRRSIPAEDVVLLENNYRSSPVICQFVSALRSIGTGSILSVGHEEGGTIHIFAGSPEFQRAQFLKQASVKDISIGDCVALAHKRKQARALAGFAQDELGTGTSSHKTFLILGCVHAIRSAKDAHVRRSAVDKVQRVILDLIEWSAEEKRMADSEKLETLGLTRSHFALYLLRLVQESAKWSSSANASSAIRSMTVEFFDGLSRPLPSLGRKLQAPKAKHWSIWSRADGDAISENETLIGKHIHAVKGKEFGGVLLSVERAANAKGVWNLAGEVGGSEALRVLYVGASRAESYLALACKDSEANKVVGFLEEKQVPYRLFCEE